MTPQDKLLPCPFCGGEGWYFQSDFPCGMKLQNVRCKKCHCAFDGCSSKKDAVDKWNLRNDCEPLVKVLEKCRNKFRLQKQAGISDSLAQDGMDIIDEALSAFRADKDGGK